MYKDHFGLSEAPFRITPHTGRFFAGAQRGAMLEALCYAIQRDEGIVRVTGEVGTGKTMLCRMLLEQLPENVQTLYIANPSLTPEALLEVLREELQVPACEPGRLLRALEAALIERHAAGRKVVVIIDEAHAMPRESLEQIRLLSNLETRTHKLLQIALFGQPELNLGILPAAGGMHRLPALVGMGVAKDFVLTGRIVDANPLWYEVNEAWMRDALQA